MMVEDKEILEVEQEKHFTRFLSSEQQQIGLRGAQVRARRSI